MESENRAMKLMKIGYVVLIAGVVDSRLIENYYAEDAKAMVEGAKGPFVQT